MKPSPAYAKFLASMQLTYERWHDGEGYDLAALKQLAAPEQLELVALLTARDVTWREVEALAAIDNPAADAALRAAVAHHLSIDTRLAAAEVLHARGQLPDFDHFLAGQIRRLNTIEGGLTRALLLAEQFPTDVVQQALLWAAWNRTPSATHCAALLCYLRGVAKEPFDWSLRPLFLRLAPDASYFDRKAAFDDLCKAVNMTLDTSQA